MIISVTINGWNCEICFLNQRVMYRNKLNKPVSVVSHHLFNKPIPAQYVQ